jgi:protein-L-isoaspartate(D-aspartate) O-methyltransferase
MNDTATQRLNMVEGQLRPSRVTDPAVLAAVAAVPRERFAPESLRGAAYVDEDLPLGGGRFLIEPMVAARLIQAAEVGRDDAVLVVGCATGYGAALLARLARRVVALECDAGLAAAARANLAAVGADGVEVVVGPLPAGWPARRPYHAILIEGAVQEIGPALADQLAEGGRLVAVVRRDRAGHAVLGRKIGGTLTITELFDAACPVLPGFARPSRFEF